MRARQPGRPVPTGSEGHVRPRPRHRARRRRSRPAPAQGPPEEAEPLRRDPLRTRPVPRRERLLLPPRRRRGRGDEDVRHGGRRGDQRHRHPPQGAVAGPHHVRHPQPDHLARRGRRSCLDRDERQRDRRLRRDDPLLAQPGQAARDRPAVPRPGDVHRPRRAPRCLVGHARRSHDVRGRSRAPVARRSWRSASPRASRSASSRSASPSSRCDPRAITLDQNVQANYDKVQSCARERRGRQGRPADGPRQGRDHEDRGRRRRPTPTRSSGAARPRPRSRRSSTARR